MNYMIDMLLPFFTSKEMSTHHVHCPDGDVDDLANRLGKMSADEVQHHAYQIGIVVSENGQSQQVETCWCGIHHILRLPEAEEHTIANTTIRLYSGKYPPDMMDTLEPNSVAQVVTGKRILGPIVFYDIDRNLKWPDDINTLIRMRSGDNRSQYRYQPRR